MRGPRSAAVALIAVLALVLSGCSLSLPFSLGFGSGGDGTFDGSELTVPVLYTSGAKGGVTTQRITAAPAPDGELRIAITENDVSGVDPVTQSATWTAVTAATLLVGARTDTAYTFGFGARIATPAAGAITAVGVLALYYDTEILPGVALAGTVSPFGAIGPVAGLPEQVAAAIEAGGIDTILVPAGQRVAMDAAGTPVDLDQLAATGGMTVAEVADLASAYAVVTGADLPAAVFPTPPASPAPPPSPEDRTAPDGSDAFADAVADLRQRYTRTVDGLADGPLVAEARDAAKRAAVLSAASDDAGAVEALVRANDLAALAAAESFEPPDAVEEATRTATEATAVLSELAATPPRSLDDADAALRASAAAVDAVALARYAEQVRSDGGSEPAIAAAGAAVALSRSALSTAETLSSLRVAAGAGPVSADADIAGVTSLLRRATVAATTAVDATRVKPRAEAEGLPVDDARALLAREDPDLLRLMAVEQTGDPISPEGDPWPALASATAAYARAAAELEAATTVPVDASDDTSAAQRAAIGAEYTERALERLTATGASVPLTAGARAEAATASAGDAASSPGAEVFAAPFVFARTLAFVAGVQRS